MTTFRIVRRDRFTTISQETVNDARLSFRARGILIWLLDKPDDWRCRSKTIAAAGAEGRDAIRAALNELATLGYLVWTKHRDDEGHWTTTTFVYERPVDNPTGQPVDDDLTEDDDDQHVLEETPGHTEAWKPGAGNPGPGNPGPSSKTETKDLNQPPNPPNEIDDLLDSAARRILEHRETQGYGPGGPGAFKAARAQLDRAKAEEWLSKGYPTHIIVASLASRVTEPDKASSPVDYWAPPEREPEPADLERVRELLHTIDA
jgi:hypothetical protein